MATNTLVITGLDRPDFTVKTNNDTNVDRLYKLITQTIPIVHWAPLKSFGRVLSVFESSEDAVATQKILEDSAALVLLNPTNNDNVTSTTSQPQQLRQIRSYFYTNTPLYSSEEEANQDMHLHPPAAPHLFFISPPPSPPVGWTSRVEDPPHINTPPPGLLKAMAAQYENDIGDDDKDIALNTDALGDTLVNACLENLTDDGSNEDDDNAGDFSDTESVNGLDMDSATFSNTLQAALIKLERAQKKRRKLINENSNNHNVVVDDEAHDGKEEYKKVNDDNLTQQKSNEIIVTTQKDERGKLTRRMTLHESNSTQIPVSQTEPSGEALLQTKMPLLSLKADDKTLVDAGASSGSPTMMTPTIILEWEEDDEEDKNDKNNANKGNQLFGSGMFQGRVKTGRPPVN